MPYQSILSGGGDTTTAPSGPRPKGYTSILDGRVSSDPSKQDLSARRKKKKQDDDAARLQQQQVQQQQAAEKKKNSLLGKVTRVAKTVGNAAITSEKTAATGIARTLPGGTADLDAQVKAAEQTNKNVQLIKRTVKDPAKAKKLIQSQADDASKTSKETTKIVKAMPSKGQVAAGIVGTGADIISGGTFSAATKSAKAAKAASLLSKAEKAKKVAKVAAPVAAANAVSGGANAAAGGGDAKTIAENAVIGAAAPVALGGVAHVTGKALTSIMDKVRVPKELIQNAKTRSLMEAANKKEADKALTETTKLDQQIELINAKKADGKFTNVDKVKVKQLEARKQELAATTPAPSVEAPATPEAPSTRPNDDLQTAIEAAHNSGNTEAAKRLEAQLPDQAMNPDAPPMTPERRASLISKARKASNTEGSMPKTVATRPNDATIETSAPKTKTDDQIPKTEKPAASENPDQVGTRTLRPSETAHMQEVAGYTHSEHMAQDYADMLRSQELQAKGGQMIPDGQGGYKRTSEHSRFFRDIYKETGKPPTKADYLEEAKKQLETGKDGIGAGDDYKTLLEREAKPAPRVQVESTVKDVPQGTSKVAQDIAKSLKEKHADLAQYEHINWKDQANKAVAVTDNRELLDKVISGEAPLPDGLRATALITAVEKHPVLGKDSELLLKIANSPLASESSLAAQELGLAAERVSSSPIEALKNLRAARQKAFEKKAGKSTRKAVSEEVKQIRAAVPKVEKETWGSFIDSLKC